MTLANAAPISVPATPKNDATTAEDTAASALAATCAALSDVFFGCSDDGRTVVSVRGEDMSSGGRAGRRERSLPAARGQRPCFPAYGDFLGIACVGSRSTPL